MEANKTAAGRRPASGLSNAALAQLVERLRPLNAETVAMLKAKSLSRN